MLARSSGERVGHFEYCRALQERLVTSVDKMSWKINTEAAEFPEARNPAIYISPVYLTMFLIPPPPQQWMSLGVINTSLESISPFLKM